MTTYPNPMATDIVGTDDADLTAMQPVVRRHNTQKLRQLIETLEPYIDGSYGPVSPRMAEVYMKALRELGLLYRIFTDLPASVEANTPLSPVEIRARVLAQLESLAAKQG